MKLDVKFSESNLSFVPKLGGSDKTFGAEYSGVQTIHGRDGESAYEIAVKNGFEGSEDAWLASLVGRPGKDGDKGDPFTYEDFTQEQLNSLKGKDGYTPVKGKDYFDGKNGQDGSNGVDGVGIKSVTQTTTSTADDGNNVITVTLTNGTKSTFKVQNGSKGSAGANGKDGYTPVKGKDYFDGKDGKTPEKGTDYFTESDKAEMVAATIAALPVYGGETE